MEGGRRPPSRRHNQASSVAAALVLLVVELAALALPVLARVPAREAAAIVETRIRAEPESHGKPLVRLPPGATMMVQGQAEDGWYRARRGKIEGYVLTGDVATAPLPAETKAGDEPGESIAVPAEVVTQEQRAGGNGDARRARNQDAFQPGAIRTASNLNLRQSPSREAAIEVVIPRRATVEPTGEHRDGFVQLAWDGHTGWALGKHLSAARPVIMDADRDPDTWSRRELIAIIYDAANHYGQPREDMLRVARCESDLVPSAVNAAGGSYGLFQFKPGTWLGTPFAEFDIFDPRASASAAAWMWSVGRRREWVCQ